MTVPLPVRGALVILGFLSVFWLPWKITILFMLFGGFVFPPAAFGIGVVVDLLYYPGSGVFWGTITGLLIMLISVAVRYFVKTRIM